MRLEIEVEGSRHEVKVDETAGKFRLEIGGRLVEGELLHPEPGVYTFFAGSRVAEARISRIAGSDAFRVDIAGGGIDVRVVDRKHRHAGGEASAEGQYVLTAPMPGKVADLLVGVGERVESGQGVVVVEAMKMQNEVKSPKSGIVSAIRVAAGEAVAAGQVLAIVD
jgi:biotin carboxyl carrier protein